MRSPWGKPKTQGQSRGNGTPPAPRKRSRGSSARGHQGSQVAGKSDGSASAWLPAWDCLSCGAQNWGHRTTCRECSARKPYAAAAKGALAHSSQQGQPPAGAVAGSGGKPANFLSFTQVSAGATPSSGAGSRASSAAPPVQLEDEVQVQPTQADLRARVTKLQLVYDTAVQNGVEGVALEALLSDLESAKGLQHRARPVTKRLEAIRQVLARKRRKLQGYEAELVALTATRDALAGEIARLEAEREVVELEYTAERHDGAPAPADLQSAVPALLQVVAQLSQAVQGPEHGHLLRAVAAAVDRIEAVMPTDALMVDVPPGAPPGQGNAGPVAALTVDPQLGQDLLPASHAFEAGLTPQQQAVAGEEGGAGGNTSPPAVPLAQLPRAGDYAPARSHARGAAQVGPYCPGLDVRAALAHSAAAQGTAGSEVSPAAPSGGLGQTASPSEADQPPTG